MEDKNIKKNGFTLIELLAVILILGIIAVITVPTIVGVLNDSRESLNENQKQQIVSAARNWGVNNLSENGGKVYYNGSEKKYITIKELQDSGYLDDKTIKDLTDDGTVASSTRVCISYQDYQYVYEYDGAC